MIYRPVDIYINTSKNVSMIYIKEILLDNSIVYCKVDINTAEIYTLKDYEFNNVFRNLKFIERSEILDEMEIMNITNGHEEYFV